jgi:hypothetical protein
MAESVVLSVEQSDHLPIGHGQHWGAFGGGDVDTGMKKLAGAAGGVIEGPAIIDVAAIELRIK